MEKNQINLDNNSWSGLLAFSGIAALFVGGSLLVGQSGTPVAMPANIVSNDQIEDRIIAIKAAADDLLKNPEHYGLTQTDVLKKKHLTVVDSYQGVTGNKEEVVAENWDFGTLGYRRTHCAVVVDPDNKVLLDAHFQRLRLIVETQKGKLVLESALGETKAQVTLPLGQTVNPIIYEQTNILGGKADAVITDIRTGGRESVPVSPVLTSSFMSDEAASLQNACLGIARRYESVLRKNQL